MKKKIFFLLLFSSFLHANFLPIVFEGNKEVDDRRLYEALNLYKPYMYEFWKEEPKINPKTSSLLVQSLKNFYRSVGFFHAQVTKNEENGVIKFFIDEKAMLKVADVAILSKIDITSVIPFKVDDKFDSELFEQSKKDIKLLYADKGFCNAELDAKTWVDLDTNKAYIVYDVTPNELCYFDSIEIFPPDNIDANIIESLLYIQENELFSPYLISQSYKNLYGHDGISKAIIDTKVQDSNKSVVNVTISENEKPIRFQVGLGVNSDEGFLFSMGVKHRNFLGNLKTLSLSTSITDVKKTLKSEMEVPLVNRSSIGLEARYEDEIFSGFKEKRVKGSLSLKQQDITYLTKESILFDSTTTYDSSDEESFEEGKLFVLSPSFQASYDTRDDLLNPTKGYRLHLELMGSLLSDISDATYYKYDLSGSYILPLLPYVLAFKTSYGSLHLYNGDIPSSYRFYAGGMNSNRAYAYRELGPENDDGDAIGFTSLIEFTAECRFPIYGNFRGVVFSDNSFTGDSSYSGVYQGYSSAGFGLRYITPIGPVAIDFGFALDDPLDQYAVHFHIGEIF